jgi:hypothetical protein
VFGLKAVKNFQFANKKPTPTKANKRQRQQKPTPTL